MRPGGGGAGPGVGEGNQLGLGVLVRSAVLCSAGHYFVTTGEGDLILWLATFLCHRNTAGATHRPTPSPP